MIPAQGREDILSGFRWYDVDVGSTHIRTAIGGSGPPLLLLHGHPQNHLTWHRIVPDLMRDYTIIAPDLRGYGDSGKPPSDTRHLAYSKRAMASDQIAVMKAFGFDRFSMVGHDRGARVGYRLALDYPDALNHLVLLDIAPTAAMYEQTNAEFARRYFWWFFLIQPSDLPERMISADPDFFVNRHIAGQMKIEGAIDKRVLEDYRRCYRDPAMRHAVCEDYRAAASIDLEYDAADAGRKITTPTLALWGSMGAVGELFDVMGCWRELVVDLRGKALPCGHSPQEEVPHLLIEELRAFLTLPLRSQ